ncbi:MAG TPA: hypothetical protein VFZ21_30475 [Gemmatimonadaceae bacterium]|jgi:hypothetical protein|nr:hypothetical protein [Gemmatimonadaceae bacterium]
MSGRFLPPDHSRGDANTIGGYAAVHARPAAFEGADGMSYSVEIVVDETGMPDRPFGAYLLFLRWRRVGAQGIEGHLETDYLSYGGTEETARDAVEKMTLNAVKGLLDDLVREQSANRPTRRWWDAMRDE